MMKVELMDDGQNSINLVYAKGRMAQLQIIKDEDGFEEEVFFSVSVNEAKQIIKGLSEYIAAT